MEIKKLNQFWLDEFSVETPVVKLTRKHERAGSRSKVIVAIPSQTLAKRLRIANGNPIGRFVYDLSCFNLLLRIYSREKIITITTPYLKTDVSGYGKVCFIKNDLSDNITCKDTLNQIKIKVKEVFHQRKLDVNLIQTLLNENLVDFTGLLQITFYSDELQERGHFDSDLVVCTSDQSIIFDFDEAYDKLFITQLAHHYLALLNCVIDSLDESINNISVLNQDEKKQLIYNFNDTQKEILTHNGFNTLLKKTVLKYPDNIAVEFESKKISYVDLNNRINKISYALNSQSIHQGEIVIVLMDRSDKLLVCLLAVWDIGAIYLPIDPLLPPDRINSIIRDSKAKHILLDFKYLNLLEEYNTFINKIIYERLVIMSKNGEALVRESKSNEIAYVIYTSGSTGNPKGVIVEHLGMINHLYAKINALKLNSESVLAQNASQAFDISIWQMLAGLLTGGKTIIYSNNSVLNMAKFIQDIANDGVNVIELVPSYLSAVINYFEARQLQDKLSKVKYLIITGEEFKVTLAKKAYELLPHISIVNAYGPTEASDDITHYTIDNNFSFDSLPIGKPLQNIHLYVVNEYMHLCPINVTGEICVSGISVGQGYLHDSDKTKIHFCSDPFDSERGRMYKTGDLGQWLPDGNMKFLGRMDDQVKINGNRIELSDVEQNLIKIPELKEAVVLVKGNYSTSQHLCAYLIAKEECDVTIDYVKSALTKLVPSYMVPLDFFFLKNLPYLTSGKVDRNKLSKIGQHQMAKDDEPTNTIEEGLLKIWGDILKCNFLRVTDNFFELGGNSLTALQLSLKINQLYKTSLQIQDIFDYPTVRDLNNNFEIRIINTEERDKPDSGYDAFVI